MTLKTVKALVYTSLLPFSNIFAFLFVLIEKFVNLHSLILTISRLPDRLRAGLQFLVLTMLVRIQLGQPQVKIL
jgi:hypothetical protein